MKITITDKNNGCRYFANSMSNALKTITILVNRGSKGLSFEIK